MRYDLGVGLALELVSLGTQAATKLLEVLDDAVVDDGDAARAVRVRMGVPVGGGAMGGPSGMADATAAHEVRVIATLAQRLHTTLALDDVQVP